MKPSATRKASTKKSTISDYEAVSTIALQLSGDADYKKIEKVLTYFKNAFSFVHVEILIENNQQETPQLTSLTKNSFFNKKSATDLKTEIFSAKKNNLKPTDVSHLLKTQNKVFFIPSQQKISGLIIESSSAILKPEFSTLSAISDIFINATCHYQKATKTEDTIRKLNRVINTSDAIYASWNHKSGWMYHNVKSFVKLGYKQKDINVETLQANNPVHVDDWKTSYPLFEKCMREGISYQHDYRATGKDGKTHWYHGKVDVTERNPNGSAKQFTSISENITNIKKSEKVLVASSESEKWLVNHANAMFNCNDYDAVNKVLIELAKYLKLDRCIVRIVDPNTLACNLVAEYCSPELESVAKQSSDLISQTGIGWISRLVDLGKSYIVNDFRAQVPDKKLVHYHETIGINAQITQPLIFENKLIGYLAVMNCESRQWKKQDIRIIKAIAETLHMAVIRNRLLDELRANDVRYELAVENSSYGIWDFDVIKNLLYVSPHYFTNLGYDPDNIECSVQFIESLSHPDDKHLLSKESLNNFAISSTTLEVEIRQRKSDGSYVWILSRGKVVQRDKNGYPLRITGVNTEIDAQKITLKQLENVRSESVAENNAKSEFLERMSHEIRTPMNAITGMSYLLMDTKIDAEQKSFVEDISSAAQSLLRIIDDILDFSKIETGELTIVQQPFSLKDELDRAIKLVTLKAKQKNNAIDFKISDDVPEKVIGDAFRVGQVLLNLLSNAVKFTENGTISLSLQLAEINAEHNNISILFSVSDSGIGLEKKQIDTLFDPFVQANDSTSRHFGGTGLGLSICKNLVEMMGGSIHVISLPNVGTTFHFTIIFKQAIQTKQLTLKNIPSSTSLNETKAKKKLPVDNWLKGKNILLVEDNIINQKVATGILSKFGIVTTEANNGQEALNILNGSNPVNFDAVLMDIEMPILDGISTSKIIRSNQQWKDLPIIAMTAHAMVGDKERCLDAGMNAYVPKPINPEKLLDVLKTTLNTTSFQRKVF